MARCCETLLLVMVAAIGCRRPAPPPPPAPAAPISAAPVASTPPAESPAPPGPASEGLVDEAAKIEAAKNKEASPDKSGPSGGEHRAPSAGGARTRAARVAEESLQPKSKQRGTHTHGAKAEEKNGGEEGKVVAARDEVAAAPESPAQVQVQVHTTLRFKNEAGANYKLVEARFVMDGAELPTVITSARRGETQQVFSGQVPAGNHVVASRLTYQGADRAIFSYMKGYTFHVKSDDGFVARGKTAVNMTIVCKEKTGFNEPVERRLFVTVE
jgi:hypothetical protein